MHGRSLVRTLDVGVIVIVTIAIMLLGLLAWAARAMDRTAFETETVIVHRQLGRLVAEFRSDVVQSAANGPAWIAARPQQRAILRILAGQPIFEMREGSRVAQLLSDRLTSERLRNALAALRKLDEKRLRVDFALIGPAGDESLALITQQPGNDAAGGLLVSILDFAALSVELEAHSINPKPVVPVRLASDGWDGRVMLSGYSGDAVAVLGWDSSRFSDRISTYVMPALAIILAIGLAVLMTLRHYWTEARDGFIRDFKAVEAVAYTDSLTGLANRRALFEHLKANMPADKPFAPVSVLMLDLDGLKWVNDNIGHQAGDRVLAQAGAVFRRELGEDGFIARLGGDEFTAVLPGDIIGDELQRLYTHLADSLREHISIEGGIQIGVSVGAVASSRVSGSGEELLRLADLAVYAAKAAGRGMALSYDPGMKQEKAYRKTVERELRAAIVDKSLYLAHQPIVDALSGRILGYESLVRWQHPTRGTIAPVDFIPIAEQSDLIVAIGNYVLEMALQELGPLGNCYISVNATGRQLLSANFVSLVENLLETHRIAPGRLCLELTETSLITERERVSDIMAQLSALGVKFAIDDFGAGYSSLSYLLQFKFDILKIDRDFIVSLDAKPEAPMIVTSIVSLARSLGMKVVGEGIETPAQQRFLASAGCNALQGYMFGKPLPLSKLELSPHMTNLDEQNRFQAA